MCGREEKRDIRSITEEIAMYARQNAGTSYQLLTVLNRIADKLHCVEDAERVTNKKLDELNSMVRSRLDVAKRKQNPDEIPLSSSRTSYAKRMEAAALLKKLNALINGYPQYDKLNAPLVSGLRELGLTTAAVD